MFAVSHTRRATKLSRKMVHSRYTLGMLLTKMRARGIPERIVAIAALKPLRNLLTEVIVSGDDVQTSLAPRRIVTYRARWLTAWAACPWASAIFAPARALLKLRPSMSGWRARIRS